MSFDWNSLPPEALERIQQAMKEPAEQLKEAEVKQVELAEAEKAKQQELEKEDLSLKAAENVLAGVATGGISTNMNEFEEKVNSPDTKESPPKLAERIAKEREREEREMADD